MLRILVRGAGDIGSAVAHCLFVAGHAVVLHEEARPSATRRQMAFTDAVFDGAAQLDGIEARRVDDLTSLERLLSAHDQIIPLSITAFSGLLKACRPAVLVDARMRKRSYPDSQLGLAPLTIGLGPNFVAGETVDIAVETSWEALGRVVTEGMTLPLAGEPRARGGHGRDRYVYAPVAGTFRTGRTIGELVEAGEVVAALDATPLLAPLRGRLRGLTRDGIPVTIGTKVIEVDPRGGAASVRGIVERPRRIAEGVLAAVRQWQAS